MSFVVTFKLLKLELVLLATTRISVTRATQGSDLAQGVTLTIQTRVVTRPFFKKIMETVTSKLWDTSWYNKNDLCFAKNLISLISNIQFYQFRAQPPGQGLMSVYNFGFTLDQSLAIISINSIQVNFRYRVKHFFHVKRHIKQHLNILITEVSNSLTLSQKLSLPNNVFQYYPEISEGVSFEEEVDGSKSLMCIGTAMLSGLNEIETILQ